MKDMTFEELLNEYLPDTIKSGSIVNAILTRKENEYSYLDLNNKLEGRIRTSEIEKYEIGDSFEVKIIKTEDDFIIVSRALIEKENEFNSIKNGDVVEGKIISKNKGGYSVKVQNIDAFLPNSLADAKDENIVGKTFKFLVKEKNKKNITLSRTDLQKKRNF